MSTWKVSYFSGVGGRPEVMLGQAPDDLEITVVHPALSEQEKIELCRDADAIVTSDITTNVLKECPNVKLIQTLSAGYDRMDLEAILEMGIPVANNGGANAIAVSEHSIALMISIGRNLMLQWNSTTKQRQWRGALYQSDLSELTDKTVGIVGLGRIGKHVAKRLTGFDTHTIYYDIVDIPEDVQQELKAKPVSFDELLQTSDIVSTRSTCSSISGSWVAVSTVTPSAVTPRSSSKICAPLAESSSPVGSSAMSSGGRFAIARAIATRCCSPPDSSYGR